MTTLGRFQPVRIQVIDVAYSDPTRPVPVQYSLSNAHAQVGTRVRVPSALPVSSTSDHGAVLPSRYHVAPMPLPCRSNTVGTADSIRNNFSNRRLELRHQSAAHAQVNRDEVMHTTNDCTRSDLVGHVLAHAAPEVSSALAS